MYHWTTSTTYTISARDTTATFWRANVTESGFVHHCLLHLVLTITALHLAHNRPLRRAEYVLQADQHYTSALPILTDELAHLRQDNCDAVLLGVQVVSFITWARGPQPDEFLAFGEDGRSDRLVMFCGIRTTIESLGFGSFTRSQAPSIRAKGPSLSLPTPHPEFDKPLAELCGYIQYNSVSGHLDLNIVAYEVLLDCYKNRYGGVDGEHHVISAWLYKMTDEFLEALQEYDAAPLVIFAHFTVLINDLEAFWYMKGWTAHVLGGTRGILRDEDRMHIRWPMATVGYIPA